MKTNLVRDIYRDPKTYIDQSVKVAGWVRTVRNSKVVGFIELNDGTCFKSIQVVFDTKLANFNEIAKLHVSSALVVEGTLVESPNPNQPIEIQATSIEVEGASLPTYPLQKKRHSLEFLRTIAHLRPRSNIFAAVFRVRSIASYAIHKFFQDRGFIYVHAPIITGSDAEGAGEMFRVTTLDLENIPVNDDGSVDTSKDFFDKETNLTVSGQLSGEAFALAFRDVYTFGPTFRAENSNTARHAAEFWMIEPEIAFADLEDNMQLAEDMVKYIISYVMAHAPEEMAFFNRFIDKELFNRLNNVINSTFEKITYTQAIELLEKADQDFEFPVKWGIDLQTEHERYITEKVFAKPVFVINYPKDIKAFYMRLNDDQKTVAAMDLLVPSIGELIGGSQREERLDVLEKRIEEMGLDEKEYWWYLELRKYGGTRHAGYGLGFERMLMYLTGIANIRDVIPFPRTPGNAEF